MFFGNNFWEFWILIIVISFCFVMSHFELQILILIILDTPLRFLKLETHVVLLCKTESQYIVRRHVSLLPLKGIMVHRTTPRVSHAILIGKCIQRDTRPSLPITFPPTSHSRHRQLNGFREGSHQKQVVFYVIEHHLSPGPFAHEAHFLIGDPVSTQSKID